MKNPSGLCLCGCGHPTPRSPTSRRGYKRGEPLKYIKGHSSRKHGPQYIERDCGYATACWTWLLYCDRNGYGKTWDGKRVLASHVHYYQQQFGKVPKGKELHHLCGQRNCVNPLHLLAVTRAEHMALDGRPAYGNPQTEVATA